MLRTILPPRCVARWVDAFWFGESDGAPLSVRPDGCMDFVFVDGRAPVLVGTMTRTEQVCFAAGTHSFGVRFRPGAAALFVNAAPVELVDAHVPLDAVVAASFVRRTAAAESDAERMRATLAHLLDGRARVRRAEPRVERASERLHETHGALAIDRLAHDLGIGTRQLERMFRERIGIAPKRFARIVRMQHARQLLEDGSLRAAQVAALAGYADEAHLSRELRALSRPDVAFVQPSRAALR